jgi:hypothetical protein
MRRTTAQLLAIAGGAVFGAAYVLVPAPSAQAMTRPSATATADTATGCLKKGSKSGEYKLDEANGSSMAVKSSSVKLAPHVGHTVTVTTTGMAMSNDTTPMSVSKVAMVKPSCS